MKGEKRNQTRQETSLIKIHKARGNKVIFSFHNLKKLKVSIKCDLTTQGDHKFINCSPYHKNIHKIIFL